MKKQAADLINDNNPLIIIDLSEFDEHRQQFESQLFLGLIEPEKKAYEENLELFGAEGFDERFLEVVTTKTQLQNDVKGIILTEHQYARPQFLGKGSTYEHLIQHQSKMLRGLVVSTEVKESIGRVQSLQPARKVQFAVIKQTIPPDVSLPETITSICKLVRESHDAQYVALVNLDFSLAIDVERFKSSTPQQKEQYRQELIGELLARGHKTLTELVYQFIQNDIRLDQVCLATNFAEQLLQLEIIPQKADSYYIQQRVSHLAYQTLILYSRTLPPALQAIYNVVSVAKPRHLMILLNQIMNEMDCLVVWPIGILVGWGYFTDTAKTYSIIRRTQLAQADLSKRLESLKQVIEGKYRGD